MQQANRILPRFLITLTLTLGALLSAAAWAQNSPKTLRVAVSHSFYPFNYIDAQGELQGFNVDVSKAICAEMKVSCRFVLLPFNDVIPALEKGDVHFAASDFIRTEARAKRINFSIKYYRSTTSLIGPSSESDMKPKKLLQQPGLRVLTIPTSTQSRYLEQHTRVTPVIMKGIGQGMAKLRNSEERYMIAPTLFVLDFLQRPENAHLDFIGLPLDAPDLTGDVHIGISKSFTDLKPRIDQALQTLIDSGKLRTLSQQYFPFDIY